MGRGNIRKLFPGSNSAYGFVSYYDQIACLQANRIIIFKGGPGVGKSSLMKKIGKELFEQGYNLEYHYCSSDNESLDALYIPEKKVALMDGTAPHVVDPKYPGAVEEIVNLGEYWDASKIREQRKEIIRLQEEISRSFQQAYRMLAAAKHYRDAAADCFPVPDDAVVSSLAEKLAEKIVAKKKKPFAFVNNTRRLFASAITPSGPVNFLSTLVDRLCCVNILNGENKSVTRRVISKILNIALECGFSVEVFPCALDPQYIDHLIIPELDTAFINSIWPHRYLEPEPNCRVMDLDQLIPPAGKTSFTRALMEEQNALQRSYQSAFHKAVFFLSRAKLLHDELEKLYIPHMQFEKINVLQKQILESILN